MNWEAIATIAEIVGAAGVIISLIYLAIQIRDSTRFNRIAERQNTTRQLTDFMDLLLLHPELADLHDKGRIDPESLSERDLIRFRRLFRRGFWYLSAQYQQYEFGAIEQDEWAESLAVIRAYVRHRGVIDWWENGQGRATSSPSFARLVDDEIAAIRFEK